MLPYSDRHQRPSQIIHVPNNTLCGDCSGALRRVVIRLMSKVIHHLSGIEGKAKRRSVYCNVVERIAQGICYESSGSPRGILSVADGIGTEAEITRLGR